MTKQEKLLARIRNNPRAVTFDELAKLLEWRGFTLRGTSGSHHVYVRGATRITLVWRRPHVHPGAVKQVLEILDEIEVE
jgi:predicted RNA binding protein YcfA (HicA-like mRNA interferase family)